MSETSEDKKNSSKRGTTLQLGGALGGKVGAGKRNQGSSVTVEVKRKRRSFASDGTQSEKAKPDQTPVAGSQDDGLTDDERNVRLKALQRAAEQRKEDEERAELEKVREQQEAEEQKNKPQAKEEEKEVVEPKGPVPIVQQEAGVVKPVKVIERAPVHSDAAKKKQSAERSEADKPKKAHKSEEKRRSNKMTVSQALSGSEERMRSLASVKRAREKARRANIAENKEREKIVRDVIVPEVITVQELANRMSERAVDVVKSLMKMGMIVTANQTIDADTAELVVSEFGHTLKRVTEGDIENVLKETAPDQEDQLQARPPVVTFMGHVDHGKTSLLDALRETDVAEGEAGGITQHIGAYQVTTANKDVITFLDTPGHEAFTAMRQRGANATDIVVLVVAADDGIMAQTVEAINHAKAAEVPIIVAINKIDKPGADIMRVRNALLEHDLVTENFGGDVLSVEVSAKEGLNMDKLLDAILLQAEMLELKANPDRSAEGVVVESRVDKGKGAVVTLLVNRGSLAVGDIVVAGEVFGKVRAMTDAKAVQLDAASPSMPVEVLGLDGAPEAGVEFHVVDTDKLAREITEYRSRRARELRTVVDKKGSLDDLFQQVAEGGLNELPIVLKADVQGSAEAIIGSLEKLSTDEVKVKVLHQGVGGITSSDVSLANASRAIVLGFNVRADNSAKELSEQEGIDIRYYSIIYDLIDDIKGLLSGLLKPTIREEFIGTAEIREVFNLTKFGKIAGCYVTDGVIRRGAGVRLLRDNVVIHEGKLKTLRRFKDDVKEVAVNFECGAAFENYEDLKVGDVIEAFELVEEKREL
jgi:translation initiation factor IF-2